MFIALAAILLAACGGPCENYARKLSLAMISTFPIAVASASVAGSLAALAAHSAVSPSSQLFGATIRLTGNASSMALTFDDGPNPSVTPQMLDLLDRHRARATFFLIGRHAAAAPALVREIAARGHALGNHTHTHPSLIFLSPRRIAEELARCDAAIASAAGQPPRWMRPPYGFRGPQLRSALRHRQGEPRPIMWSRMACDWRPQPPEPVIRRLRRARGGDIVLLHDGDHRVLDGDRFHTLRALEYWLPRWTAAGLKFASLDDISGGA